MQVICKRSMLIRKPAIASASASESQVAIASANYHQLLKGEKIKVNPSTDPQVVPDWVRDTIEFQHASSDGTMIEVQVKGRRTARVESYGEMQARVERENLQREQELAKQKEQDEADAKAKAEAEQKQKAQSEADRIKAEEDAKAEEESDAKKSKGASGKK